MVNKNFFVLKNIFETEIIPTMTDQILGQKFLNCLDAIERADDEELFQRIDHSKYMDGTVLEMSDHLAERAIKERKEELERKKNKPKCQICGAPPKSFMNTKHGDFTVCKKCGDALMLAAEMDIKVERKNDE